MLFVETEHSSSVLVACCCPSSASGMGLRFSRIAGTFSLSSRVFCFPHLALWRAETSFSPSTITSPVLRSTASNTLPPPLLHPRLVRITSPTMSKIHHCDASSLLQLPHQRGPLRPHHRRTHQTRAAVHRARRITNLFPIHPVNPVPSPTYRAEVRWY
jgi:hypothetical protein